MNDIPTLLSLTWMAIIFGVIGGLGSWRGLRSYDWRKTNGVIERSGIKKVPAYPFPMFAADVLYTYSVEGVSHTGTTIAYRLLGATNPGTAEKFVRPYAKGTCVVVFFDPHHPQHSVLIRGVSAIYVLSLFCGLVMAAAVVAHALGLIVLS